MGKNLTKTKSFDSKFEFSIKNVIKNPTCARIIKWEENRYRKFLAEKKVCLLVSQIKKKCFSPVFIAQNRRLLRLI